MHIGQVLMAAENGGPYYSPWFSRGGNAATFVCDLIATFGGATGLTITIETKNSEQDDKAAGDGTNPTWGPWSVITIGNTNVFQAGSLLSDLVNQGFLELVRFKIEIEGGIGAGAGVHYRMLNPSWLGNGA